jgi:hypothetical protein
MSYAIIGFGTYAGARNSWGQLIFKDLVKFDDES